MMIVPQRGYYVIQYASRTEKVHAINLADCASVSVSSGLDKSAYVCVMYDGINQIIACYKTSEQADKEVVNIIRAFEEGKEVYRCT